MLLLPCRSPSFSADVGNEAGNRKEDGDSFGKSLATFEEVEELGMIFGMTQKQGSSDA